MNKKILQVFYGADALPYKDKERTVHFPIVGNAIQNANNTTQIKFYFDRLIEENEQTTFVAVSKLPNGKIGSKILETYDDEELGEQYALLDLDSFYTQYKGNVFISLQGYQGGVRVEQDEQGIYQIYGTPVIAATGSIKLAINYAPSFIGSGETENVTLQQVLGELSTKLGVRQETLHVEELPTVGNPDVWYVANDDEDDPNKVNIYIWNATTQSYIWVGDNTLNLGDYYTTEQGEQFESNINGDIATFKEQVENEIESVASGSPKGVYATLSDLETAYPTGTTGIYVVSADGHWYYWNGSAWTDGGVYLSTGDALSVNDANKTFVKQDRKSLDFVLIQGNKGASSDNVSTNRLTLQRGLSWFIKILKNTNIKTKTGWEVSLYDGVNIYDTGWRTDYTVTSTSYHFVIFRKSNDAAISPSDYTLSDILEDDTIFDLVTINEDYTNNVPTSSYKWIYQILQGNKGIGLDNIASNRCSIIFNGTLPAYQKITTKSGWLFAAYNSSFVQIFPGGWISENAQNSSSISIYILAFKKSDDSDIDVDSVSLEDILQDTTFVYNKKELSNDVFIDYSKVLNSPQRWKGKTAYFLGDSITAGAQATHGKLYFDLLKTKLGLLSSVGNGEYGSCLSVTSNYGSSPAPFSQRWNSIPDSDLIVLFGGTNDYGHDTPIGAIDDATDISFYGALNVILSGLINKFPKRRIAFMTPLHRYNLNNNFVPDSTPNGQGKTLKDYVDAIKIACEKYGVPVIDTYSISGLNPSLYYIQINYMGDGLHPNDAGHKLIAERTAGLFNNL